MATRKYIIIGDDDNPIGHILLKDQNPTFEHTTPYDPIPKSGPIADGALFVIVLGGLTAVPWIFGAPGWLAAGCGVCVTSVLAGIKAWRGSFATLPQSDDSMTIKGEFTNADDGTLHLDEITDKDILPQALKAMCKAIEQNDFAWVGRPTAKLKYGVSRTQHARIRAQFEHLGYIVTQNGQDHVNGRGRLFVRKLAAMAAGGGWLRGGSQG